MALMTNGEARDMANVIWKVMEQYIQYCEELRRVDHAPRERSIQRDQGTLGRSRSRSGARRSVHAGYQEKLQLLVEQGNYLGAGVLQIIYEGKQQHRSLPDGRGDLQKIVDHGKETSMSLGSRLPIASVRKVGTFRELRTFGQDQALQLCDVHLLAVSKPRMCKIKAAGKGSKGKYVGDGASLVCVYVADCEGSVCGVVLHKATCVPRSSKERPLVSISNVKQRLGHPFLFDAEDGEGNVSICREEEKPFSGTAYPYCTLTGCECASMKYSILYDAEDAGYDRYMKVREWGEGSGRGEKE